MKVHRRGLRADRAGFALLDLIFVVVLVSLFAAIWTSLHSRFRERIYITIDLNNIRQILHGSALYNADNNDHMAHPTWGSDLTGPDGWAYLTSKGDREIPGALANFPTSCANRDVNSSQFTNQLAYFKVGQVSQYLPDVKTAWCPKDVATRNSGGRLRMLWLGRPVKVTSYSWNGTIGGYVGPRATDLKGRTYKVSQFQATDWQMWEGNESTPFNFNDAADDPETFETFSQRHTGTPSWWTTFGPGKRDYRGGAVVGTFGGSASYVRWSKIYDLVAKKIAAPNEILNGPGYR